MSPAFLGIAFSKNSRMCRQVCELLCNQRNSLYLFFGQAEHLRGLATSRNSLIPRKQTTYIIRERTNDDPIQIAMNANNRKKTSFRNPAIHRAFSESLGSLSNMFNKTSQNFIVPVETCIGSRIPIISSSSPSPSQSMLPIFQIHRNDLNVPLESHH